MVQETRIGVLGSALISEFRRTLVDDRTEVESHKKKLNVRGISYCHRG